MNGTVLDECSWIGSDNRSWLTVEFKPNGDLVIEVVDNSTGKNTRKARIALDRHKLHSVGATLARAGDTPDDHEKRLQGEKVFGPGAPSRISTMVVKPAAVAPAPIAHTPGDGPDDIPW